MAAYACRYSCTNLSQGTRAICTGQHAIKHPVHANVQTGIQQTVDIGFEGRAREQWRTCIAPEHPGQHAVQQHHRQDQRAGRRIRQPDDVHHCSTARVFHCRFDVASVCNAQLHCNPHNHTMAGSPMPHLQ